MKLSGKEVSQTDLQAMPAFVLFDTIAVNYYPGEELLTQKSKWIVLVLQPLKHCINGANLEFYCDINSSYDSDFNDHSTLLAHIGNELLPICSACRSYKFVINFYSDYSSATKIIEKFFNSVQSIPVEKCCLIYILMIMSRQICPPISLQNGSISVTVTLQLIQIG